MKNPRQIIAAIAAEYVGLRETSTNRGPHLEEFWRATGYPDGAENREPWCSAFVTFCVKEADRRSADINLRVPPFFPGAAQWVPWAQKPETGCLVFTSVHGDIKPQAGDIVVFLPHISHVGIVAQDYDGRGVVATIEGNTNAGGSREGDGVFQKLRSIAFCGTFIRVPTVAHAA